MSRKKLLWSIDLYEKNLDLQKGSLPLLKRWSEALDLDVEPLFILGPKSLRVGLDQIVPLQFSDFMEYAEKNMKKFCEGVDLKNLSPSKVLLCEDYSVRSQAKILLDYARKEKVEAIVMQTHAREGILRFWLGSFAENILFNSDIPLLTINPDTEFDVTKHILHPTLFDEKSHDIFEKVSSKASLLGAEMTLYHSSPSIESYFPTATRSLYLSEDVYNRGLAIQKQHEEKVTKIFDKWKTEAADKGVKLHLVISREPGNISENIIHQAEKLGVDLIAMASNVGRLEDTVFGSIVRQVNRYALCPVWSIHGE